MNESQSQLEPGSRRNTNLVFLLGPDSGCTVGQIEPGFRGWPGNQTPQTWPIQAKSQVWTQTKHTPIALS
jgi:hypothetical protein